MYVNFLLQTPCGTNLKIKLWIEKKSVRNYCSVLRGDLCVEVELFSVGNTGKSVTLEWSSQSNQYVIQHSPRERLFHTAWKMKNSKAWKQTLTYKTSVLNKTPLNPRIATYPVLNRTITQLNVQNKYQSNI